MTRQSGGGRQAVSDAGVNWPFRIFLDSNALQALYEHGGTIFDGEEYAAGGARSGANVDDVEALRLIFHPGLRDAFEFALSNNSIAEVAAARSSPYLQWAFDVLDYWEVCLREGDPSQGWGLRAAQRLGTPDLGYLSAKDRGLIRDALLLECDTFLTIERRLPRNGDHLRHQTGLQVVRPPELWARVRPALSGI